MPGFFHLEKVMQLNLCINQKHNEIRQHLLSGTEDILLCPSKQHFKFFLKSKTPQNLFLNLLQGQTIEALSPAFAFSFILEIRTPLSAWKIQLCGCSQCFLLGALCEWQSVCRICSFFLQGQCWEHLPAEAELSGGISREKMTARAC